MNTVPGVWLITGRNLHKHKKQKGKRGICNSKKGDKNFAFNVNSFNFDRPVNLSVDNNLLIVIN